MKAIFQLKLTARLVSALAAFCFLAVLSLSPVRAESAADAKNLVVPVHRSVLVVLPKPMAEAVVADPDIADIHAHTSTLVSVMGKKLGRTGVRVFEKNGRVLREMEVVVGYDLPAIRRSLKNFLPDETIKVEMVNTSIALTGEVRDAAAADKAIRIVKDFLRDGQDDADKQGRQQQAQQTQRQSEGAVEPTPPEILNLLHVASGQQVMLRVRVGEIRREALKTLGIDLNILSQASGTGLVGLGTGTGIAGLSVPTGSVMPNQPGVFTVPSSVLSNTQGVLMGRWQPDGVGGNTVSGLLRALERDGLFKLLAEPNLVAISGEQAEFLAGGEIPIPVVQGSVNTNNTVTIEYKPFGVAVRFTPFVLSESRIRMMVQPEVSEISTENALLISGFSVPSITTRRAKTVVELAPGESFMIAGLIKDQTRASIDQLPGVRELPVLGALFRSTEFRRNETELVIAVTPYVVDPVRSADVKLPTDRFRPASQMDLFFYGALGSLSGGAAAVSQTPVEGPIGFMVD